MRDPVIDDRRDPRIAEQRLIDARGRRIAVEGRLDVAGEEHPNARQLTGELVDDLVRAPIADRAGTLGVRTSEGQASADLRLQRHQGRPQRVPHEVVQPLVGQIQGPEVGGKEGRAEILHDRRQRLPRGQHVPTELSPPPAQELAVDLADRVDDRTEGAGFAPGAHSAAPWASKIPSNRMLLR